MPDPMQEVFNGAEAAQDALHSQEGCELALRLVLDRIATNCQPLDWQNEQIILALIDSMGHFRDATCAEVARMQKASLSVRPAP